MKNSNISVSFDENAFQITADNTISTHLWTEIDKITAFKRDLFVVDLICLLIENNETTFELNEEQTGWNAFIEELSHQFPQIKKIGTLIS